MPATCVPWNRDKGLYAPALSAGNAEDNDWSGGGEFDQMPDDEGQE